MRVSRWWAESTLTAANSFESDVKGSRGGNSAPPCVGLQAPLQSEREVWDERARRNQGKRSTLGNEAKSNRKIDKEREGTGKKACFPSTVIVCPLRCTNGTDRLIYSSWRAPLRGRTQKCANLLRALLGRFKKIPDKRKTCIRDQTVNRCTH